MLRLIYRLMPPECFLLQQFKQIQEGSGFHRLPPSCDIDPGSSSSVTGVYAHVCFFYKESEVHSVLHLTH